MTASRFPFRGILVAALYQLGLAAVLFLLLAIWLHIPDANAFEVLLSVVLALLLAAVAGAGESLIAMRLTERAITARRLVLGAVAVIVAALLWYAASEGVEKLGARDYLYAGYLNSRVPASLRNVFSYEHIASWLGWLWNAVRWSVFGLLAALAFAIATGEKTASGLRAVLQSRQCWLALLSMFLVGTVATERLVNWTPGHGLAAEALSLAARLLLAVVLNALAAGYLLQAMSAAVVRSQAQVD